MLLYLETWRAQTINLEGAISTKWRKSVSDYKEPQDGGHWWGHAQCFGRKPRVNKRCALEWGYQDWGRLLQDRRDRNTLLGREGEPRESERWSGWGKDRNAHGAEETSEDGSKTQRGRGDRATEGSDTKMFEEEEETWGTSQKMGVT